jgi:biotin carboxyl carrier protein
MPRSVTAIHRASERGDVTSKDWRVGRGRDGRAWIFAALATAVLAVAAIALALLGVGPAPQAAAIAPMQQQPVLTVTVAPAEVRPMAHSVSGNGSVVAWQELTVAAEVSGLRVVDIAVDEGDQVRSGQILVRFDDAMLAAQLARLTRPSRRARPPCRPLGRTSAAAPSSCAAARSPRRSSSSASRPRGRPKHV